MEQTILGGKKKEPVELKESYGGFEVCYPDHVDYKDITPKLVRSGSEIIKQFPSYQEAKEDFEREIRRIYKTDVIWVKLKFQDSKGCFWLDGVRMNWELKTCYIGDYHLEFNSEKETPTLLTETGYLSDFPNNLDAYDSVVDYIKDLLHYKINCDDKGKENKRLKNYRLDWKNEGYIPSKQFTLTELEGGVK